MKPTNTCVLYSNQRESRDYVARAERPLSVGEWQQILDRAASRWVQIDNFLGKGHRLPISLQDGEEDAYLDGVIGMLRWMYPEIAVTRAPVPKFCYDPYPTTFSKTA
jgi:hypothetical protein